MKMLLAERTRYWKCMENIMEALRLECPLEGTAVNTFQGPVPLQDYIAGIPGQSEAETFFTGEGPFSLFYLFPLELERYKDRTGITEGEAGRIQERFDKYTWSETPEARKAYYRARTHARIVANYQYNFPRNPGLSSSIKKLLARDEFSDCPIIGEVAEMCEDISETEYRFDEIPQTPILKRVIPRSDAMSQRRLASVRDISRSLRKEAGLIEEPMKSLGHEYRERYLKEHLVRHLELF
ncbi:MAG: hypothetical protein HYT73_02760 [Candidatus Aenigmarchaeota archaeon]|nr:hypothetical protein [Candidatus Aenigmarchaeota archaeon]